MSFGHFPLATLSFLLGNRLAFITNVADDCSMFLFFLCLSAGKGLPPSSGTVTVVRYHPASEVRARCAPLCTTSITGKVSITITAEIAVDKIVAAM